MKENFSWENGISVDVIDGDIEKALKKFKKRVQNAGIFQELKKREHYIKPSEQVRRKRGQAISRARKQNKMDEEVIDFF